MLQFVTQRRDNSESIMIRRPCSKLSNFWRSNDFFYMIWQHFFISFSDYLAYRTHLFAEKTIEWKLYVEKHALQLDGYNCGVYCLMVISLLSFSNCYAYFNSFKCFGYNIFDVFNELKLYQCIRPKDTTVCRPSLNSSAFSNSATADNNFDVPVSHPQRMFCGILRKLKE